MEISEIVSALAGIATVAIGGVIWGIRLEGRHNLTEKAVDVQTESIAQHEKRLQQLEINVAVEAKALQQMQSDIKEIKVFITTTGFKQLQQLIIDEIRSTRESIRE